MVLGVITRLQAPCLESMRARARALLGREQDAASVCLAMLRLRAVLHTQLLFAVDPIAVRNRFPLVAGCEHRTRKAAYEVHREMHNVRTFDTEAMRLCAAIEVGECANMADAALLAVCCCNMLFGRDDVSVVCNIRDLESTGS